MNVDLVLYVCATLCFALSSFGTQSKVNLFHLGWAFLAASLVV